uniref:Peptidase metallopeptidase domain-containing protein n=1 Tax=Xiphophorus couchianus TaxID=32473 RepID=A0A3B5L8C8_9TELE
LDAHTCLHLTKPCTLPLHLSLANTLSLENTQTYTITLPRQVRTFPKDSALLGRDTVRALMYYALKVWSDIAPLNFHEVAGSDADIQIDFTKADHNDGYPFDGPGGTVAHAFFPGERFTAGDTHFDDDEAWTFRSPAALEALAAQRRSGLMATPGAPETPSTCHRQLSRAVR